MDLSLPEPLGSLLKNIEHGAITNFYGGPGTGKTCACALAVIQNIKNGGSVVYLDTEGGFSLERLKQLTSNWSSVLDKTALLEPKTFAEQGKIIRNLENKKASLVIVDSVVALYRLEYAEQKEVMEANRELSKQLSLLSTLARNKNIPVIITAHTFRNWNTGQNEVIGGETLKYWSKVLVHLERTSRMSERRATLIKHRSLPEGKSIKFMLTQTGIKPAGFKLF